MAMLWVNRHNSFKLPHTCITGPMATAPVACCTALYVLLPLKNTRNMLILFDDQPETRLFICLSPAPNPPTCVQIWEHKDSCLSGHFAVCLDLDGGNSRVNSRLSVRMDTRKGTQFVSQGLMTIHRSSPHHQSLPLTSYWMGPSTMMSGRRLLTMATASTTFWTCARQEKGDAG